MPVPPAPTRHFALNADFQQKLLGLMIDSVEGISLGKIIRAEYFEHPLHRRMARVIVQTMRRLKTGITWGIFRSELQQALSSAEYVRALGIVKHLRTNIPTQTERAYLFAEVSRFCKLQAIGHAIIQSVDLHQQQNVDALDRLWTQTLNIGAPMVDDGFDLFTSLPERYARMVTRMSSRKSVV